MTQKEFDDLIKRLKDEENYGAYSAVAGAFNRSIESLQELPLLKVAVLRNFTFEPLLPVIKGEIVLSGYFPELYVGEFDNIAQDIFSPDSSLYKFEPDVIVVAQWLDALSPLIANRFLSLDSKQVAEEFDRIINGQEELLVALRKSTRAPVVINNFALPSYVTLGAMDAQSENFQTNTYLKLNLELSRLANNFEGVYIIDYMRVMAMVGSEKGVDRRYWQMGRAPIGKNVLVPFGQEYGKYFKALKGKSKKCLVLDCDNVLWGGIVGEDGLEGIKLGENYPGSCFQRFQEEILNLHDRGVILALCSKNNGSDVLEVLRDHPAMVLKEENISTWQINWDDKATNIIRIAEELNIGLDSIVFVDDSPYECGLVRQQLPEVEVLELSTDSSSFVSKLSKRGYFDSLVFSKEDSKRNQMYRDQATRKKIYKSAGSLEDYFKNLQMVAEIGLVDDGTLQRIVQLTQKTNQFNLTTKRYTEGDIVSFKESDSKDVFYLKLKDRVSDMGLVGVAIVEYKDLQADIDTFLLSCRVIGRGVEDAFLMDILSKVKQKGCKSILGHYRVSRKNGQVADYFDRQNFELLDKNDEGSNWKIELDGLSFEGPDWIKVQQM